MGLSNNPIIHFQSSVLEVVMKETHALGINKDLK